MITDRITTELSTGYGTVNVKLSKSFEFLEGGSDIIDCDLALTALILSSYVYNGNKAVDLLNRLGFDYTDMPIGEKSQAFHPLSAMGYKKLVTSSGQSKNLFVIAVKGTDPEHTWIEDIICSDIIDGAVSMFDICRSRVVDDFKAFAVSATGKDIDTLKNEENYIVLTGHSLGGATANCLSVDQTMMELTNNKKDRIFTYTFEPPHTCINLWWMNPEKMSCAFNFKDRDDFITNVPPYSGSTTYGKDISFDVKELDDDIFLKLFPDANGGSVLEAPKLENYGDLWGHHDIGLDFTYLVKYGLEHNWWDDLSDVVPSGSEAKMTQVILSEERVNTDEDWKKGYMDILRGVKPDGEWEKDAYSYQIYDIDENGVPEFWIRPPYEDTSFTIYTFCDGNVIPTGETHNWHLSVCPLTGENGIILRCGQDMVEQVRIAQLIDGKLEENEAYDLSVENWTEYETLKKYRLNDTSGIINWSHNLPDSNRERLNQIMKSNENPEPFYGIWCGASKQYSDMEKKADELISKGFNAKICETTDWSNLNDEWWVVVSAGVYDTEEGAQADLDNVKSFYPDAYIKYSGDYKAGLNKNSDTWNDDYSKRMISNLIEQCESYEFEKLFAYNVNDVSYPVKPLSDYDMLRIAVAATDESNFKKMNESEFENQYLITFEVNCEEVLKKAMDIFGKRPDISAIDGKSSQFVDYSLSGDTITIVEHAYETDTDYEIRDVIVENKNDNSASVIKEAFIGHWGKKQNSASLESINQGLFYRVLL